MLAWLRSRRSKGDFLGRCSISIVFKRLRLVYETGRHTIFRTTRSHFQRPQLGLLRPWALIAA